MAKAVHDENRPRYRVHPDDEAEVRAALEEAEKHPERLRSLSPEELDRSAETGEWPESQD